MDTPSKDGKNLPMFTPKNSEGSQRVIKQIMVIDPNKLRVAGLDLKMAEALKKSKSSKGNMNSIRTKEDKLALAKTLLNRKLKQVKFSQEAQIQNITKEKCDSPQKHQSNVSALQSLLSSPRTFIKPAPKQPHTMLVNITGNDPRTGSFELSISNKPHMQQEKLSVEQIPKASIKITKPVKTKDAPPKIIESMVISPEVKFEVKRKSLPASPKRTCSDSLGNLPKVIESKVLSPEEKIDMKTLCGSTTKPVPATVRIEITKHESVPSKGVTQVNSLSVSQRPKEYAPKTTAQPTTAKIKIEPPKQEYEEKVSESVNVVTVQEKSKEFDLLPASKAKSEIILTPNSKHVPEKIEPPAPVLREESAVDFINNLQMSVQQKCDKKLKPELKVEPSGVQEDATSFLMSLFAQETFTATVSPEVTKNVENKAVNDAKNNLPQTDTKPEMNSATKGHRRNIKPLPIIKHKPRFSGAAKVAKPQEQDPSETVPNFAIKTQTTELRQISSDLTTETDSKEQEGIVVNVESMEALSSTLLKDKTDSMDKGMKSITEYLASEMKSAGSAIEESASESIEICTPSIPMVGNERLENAIQKENESATIANDFEKEVVVTNSAITEMLVEDSAVELNVKKVEPKTMSSHEENAERTKIVHTNVDEPSPKGDKFGKAEQAKNVIINSVPVLVDETTVEAEVAASVLPSTQNVIESFVHDRVKSDVMVRKENTPKVDETESKNVPAEHPETETMQQTAKQIESESKKIDSLVESMSTNVPKTESAPPPSSRRKGKKSVPVLIAKLKKSRKPACLPGEPKETQTPVPLVNDKSQVLTNEATDTKEAASNSVQIAKSDSPTSEVEKKSKQDLLISKEDEASHCTSKEEEKAVPSQTMPQKSSLSESPLKQTKPVTSESAVVMDVENQENKLEAVLNKSVTEGKLERLTNESKTVTEIKTSETKLGPANENEMDAQKQLAKLDPINTTQTGSDIPGPQLELMTNKCISPKGVEKSGIAVEPVKGVSAESTVLWLQSNAPSVVSGYPERLEEINDKQEDVKLDCQAVVHKLSGTTTDEISQGPPEEIPTTIEPISEAKECLNEDKAFISPKKMKEVAKPHDKKSPEKQKGKGKRQTKVKSETNVAEDTAFASTNEAKSIPFPRVRKKSVDSMEHMTLPPEAPPTDVEISTEVMPDEAKQAYTEYLALSHIESPNIESSKGKPNLKKELSSKIKECNEKLLPRSEEEHKGILSCPADIFDTIREEKVVRNETAPLPPSGSKTIENESDEFDHHDSDFGVSFQDDTENDDTAAVDNLEELQSSEKISPDKANKSMYQSKEDLDFLGFNESEIEEGQQSTSLRLSQSEDVSPLKPTPQSETPARKKTTPSVKKTPLSAGKKQKAEQANWKKNSAKSLQSWLKSSDKDTSGKDVDTCRKETNEVKAVDSVEFLKRNISDTKSPANLSENNATQKPKTPVRGRQRKGKEAVVAEKNEKPENPLRKSVNNVKDIGEFREAVDDSSKTANVMKEPTQPEGSTPSPLCAADSKTMNKSSARGQKSKKIKKEELAQIEDDLNTPSKLEERGFILDKVKTNIEAMEVKASIETPSLRLSETSRSTQKETPSTTASLTPGSTLSKTPSATPGASSIVTPNSTPIRGQRKKRVSLAEKSCAIEGESDPTPKQKMELGNTLFTTPKRKLEEVTNKDPIETDTPTPTAPRQKRKYTRRSGVTATPSEKTPKSSHSKNNSKSEEPNEAEKAESIEEPTTPLTKSNTRKRKAPKDDTEIPKKVSHISEDPDFRFTTPTPKKRGPKKKVEVVDSPDVVITPKADRKYKNTAEFNPRLLLIRKKEDLKSDAPLVDPTLQTVPKSKDDVQCALCMGYTPKKKWLQHISDHYGVGWVVGTPPPLNITCRNAVLSYMIEFFKTSKVKGLNCRICQVLRRSALGLLAHLEQCCLTEEEIKESRLVCEHCNKEYSKSSMTVHLRSCTELWKKNKQQNEPEQKAPEESQEVVLSNTGRLKRKSVIKAEHKFKEMDTAEFTTEEMIKHITEPRKDNWEAAWDRDIKSFGKGFCVERKCHFTAETVEELREHCQPGVCPHFVQPGFYCLKCKFYADNMEAAQKHVDKHMSKPTEDFQDSEDEAVISHVSSSEDGSSGDEEVSEEGSVDQEGSEKQKSKKKGAKSSKQRVRMHPPKRNVPIKDIRKLVPPRVQKTAAEVAKLHQDFIKENYSEEPLFSYATPIISEVMDDGIDSYFSKSSISPKFTLKGFRKPFVDKLGRTPIEPHQWQQLQRLNGIASKCEHMMYLGGPVKTIAWVPISTSTPTPYQYLASVTRKEQNKFTRYLQPKQSRSLVYIHRYQLDGTVHKRLTGEIYYAIALDDGPIHCIEFLPSGGYEPETNRLGLLAVGTIKSEVKVYSLPLNVQKRDCDMCPILRLEPSFVLGLEMEETKNESSDYHRTQCTSITWSQFAGHSHIIAGFLNGFVAIWDITEDDDNLNRFLVNGGRQFVPISYFWTKDDRIRRVTVHYDINGLRWLAVCSVPRRMVFYDIRDINRPLQIMDERTKNECNAVDWPVVWANPAFALGDSLPTHGNCLNSISPSSLAYVSKKFEKFCCGVTDLHFNPWNNMYAAGAENGDIQVTPLRDTVLDVSLRRKKDEKILTSLDIVPLNGGEVSENIIQSSRLLETDYSDKFGIAFGSVQHVIGVKTPQLYSTARIPPLALTRLTRVNQVRFNLNQKTNTFLAVGYANGMVRVLMDKWEDPLKAVAAYSEAS